MQVVCESANGRVVLAMSNDSVRGRTLDVFSDGLENRHRGASKLRQVGKPPNLRRLIRSAAPLPGNDALAVGVRAGGASSGSSECSAGFFASRLVARSKQDRYAGAPDLPCDFKSDPLFAPVTSATFFPVLCMVISFLCAFLIVGPPNFR
jgi:hypothetical protein